MKVAPVVAFLLAVAVFDVVYGRPLEEAKQMRDASVYVLGSLYNAAVSHNFSKAQAASDRNESEWNSTEMLNGVNKNPDVDEEVARSGVLIYTGGDAANLAVAYHGSESQAAENDQKSGYNNQNLGMGVAESSAEEEAYDEYQRKR